MERSKSTGGGWFAVVRHVGHLLLLTICRCWVKSVVLELGLMFPRRHIRCVLGIYFSLEHVLHKGGV